MSDTDTIYETDIDWVGEIMAADVEAQEVIDHFEAFRVEVQECCNGRSPNCGHHYGFRF